MGSPAALLDALDRGRFDLVLMDLNYARGTTSGQEGLDLLAAIRARDAALPVVVMTAWATVDLAIEGLRHRRRRFRAQAVGQRAAGGHGARPGDGRRARGARRRSSRSARWRRRARSRRRCCPASFRSCRLRHRRLLAAGARASAATTTTCSRSVRGTWRCCIADVAGKGMPAALLMSNLQAAVRALAAEGWSPRELCGHLHRDHVPAAGRREVRDVRVPRARRRHRRPDLHQRRATTRRCSCAPTARTRGWKRAARSSRACRPGATRRTRVDLRPGDRLVLFTDGFTELPDARGRGVRRGAAGGPREGRTGRLDASGLKDRAPRSRATRSEAARSPTTRPCSSWPAAEGRRRRTCRARARCTATRGRAGEDAGDGRAVERV